MARQPSSNRFANLFYSYSFGLCSSELVLPVPLPVTSSFSRTGCWSPLSGFGCSVASWFSFSLLSLLSRTSELRKTHQLFIFPPTYNLSLCEKQDQWTGSYVIVPLTFSHCSMYSDHGVHPSNCKSNKKLLHNQHKSWHLLMHGSAVRCQDSKESFH